MFIIFSNFQKKNLYVKQLKRVNLNKTIICKKTYLNLHFKNWRVVKNFKNWRRVLNLFLKCKFTIYDLIISFLLRFTYLYMLYIFSSNLFCYSFKLFNILKSYLLKTLCHRFISRTMVFKTFYMNNNIILVFKSFNFQDVLGEFIKLIEKFSIIKLINTSRFQLSVQINSLSFNFILSSVFIRSISRWRIEFRNSFQLWLDRYHNIITEEFNIIFKVSCFTHELAYSLFLFFKSYSIFNFPALRSY